jgi:phosphatidylinositol glycan class K
MIESNNNNNWIVIVNTSRYWFNYRHLTNALTIYSIVKKLGNNTIIITTNVTTNVTTNIINKGINDDHIIFMNAFDYACDTRNLLPGRIYYNNNHNDVNFDDDNDNNNNNNDLYNNVEIDYKGNQVKVSKFINIMIGNHDHNDPNNGKLLSDSNSNILIYLSGHGGDEFLKFQDNEEISSQDIGKMIKEMEILKRYHQILFIVDTCQASTLANYITSPNIIFFTSSLKGENSYAYHISNILGVSLIDRFTFTLYQFFNNYIINNNDNDNASRIITLQNLFDFMDYRFLHSTPNIAINTGLRDLSSIPIIEFFGNTKKVKYNIVDKTTISQSISDTISIDECYNKRINDLYNTNISITTTSSNDNDNTNDNNNNKSDNDIQYKAITINVLLSILLCLILLYMNI